MSRCWASATRSRAGSSPAPSPISPRRRSRSARRWIWPSARPGCTSNPSWCRSPPASELFSASVTMSGSNVGDGDIARVLSAGSEHSVRAGRALMHSLPIGYALDGAKGIRDPRGMLGREFGIDMHVMTVDLAVARNLMLAIERCHIDIAAMVASPYAAGLAVLADDEADLGAAVVDMGAGTTTIAVFAGGRFVHASGFAIGGQNVT